MKYVRNFDDLKKYTFEFFDSFLTEELSDSMVNVFLTDAAYSEELKKAINREVVQKPILAISASDYGEVILQLKEYKELLKKFVELLLETKSFEGLCAFLNRIFLQQIGPVKYHSRAKDYTMDQRYFDRFVEIIDYCEIKKELFTPFFVAIFNSQPQSSLFAFKEPLMEYLDVFIKDGNEDFVLTLLGEKQDGEVCVEQKTDKVKNLREVIEEYVSGDLANASLIKSATEKNKALCLNLIEEYLPFDDERTERACDILLMIDDKRAREILKSVFRATQNQALKSKIEQKCGLKTLVMFKSQEDFISHVDSCVTKVQDRLYGIRLTRYFEEYNIDVSGINGKIVTFVLETFRKKDCDEYVSHLKEYFKFVDIGTLQSLCDIVFEIASQKEKLLSSLWAIRLISCFGSPALFQKIFAKMEAWYKVPSSQKACNYFLDIMSICSRSEMLDGVKNLLEKDLTVKQKRVIGEKLEKFSLSNKQDIEEVKDKLALDLGFDSTGRREIKLAKRTLIAQINIDCTISLFNLDGKRARISASDMYEWQDLKTYIKKCESKIKAQKKRLYSAFLEFRNYTTESFKECILVNNLLNFLAQHLYFGRYKNDRLVEVCLIRDGKLSHLMGNMVSSEEEYTIAMLQPIDVIDMKDRIAGVINPLFDQLNFPYFTSYDLNYNVNYVDKLAGRFCNANLFVTRLQKHKYKVADAKDGTYGMLVKKNENLGLITTVEFDRIPLKNYATTTTLSKIRFYELTKQNANVKNAELDKREALMLSSINPHVLSNELALILIASMSN